VARQRLQLLPRCREEVYFRHYQAVDVALDPFPWAGGTTTCDALWMGVPVVTLVDDQAGSDTVSRGGLSLATNLGHPEWVARSEDQYIANARELAADLPHLAALRQNLRSRMAASVIMDAPRFAKNMVAAYRQAWRAWCALD
jgi:protein O-GlcNAc transferase